MERPYERLAEQLSHRVGGPDGCGIACAAARPDRTQRMQTAVDMLWEALSPTGVSWVGFYVHEGADELILGPRRDKPACSPIGMHGACGQSFTSREPLVVRDVADLGEGYIACDPRDRSELVVPLIDETGACYGVLDLDSYDVGSFDDRDVTGLQGVLRAAGLTH
jgi:putative methionine-R-sulfoxide reductase with GAF domain